MKVSKSGRLPAAVVEALALKEGDAIEVTIAGGRDRSREKAIESIKRSTRPFPPGFMLDREEAHER